MSADTVNKLLDERARLITRNTAIEGHLWAAELLLRRAHRYLQEMVAPNAALAVARDTICDEINELLTEDRPHPGALTELPASGGEAADAGTSSGDAA